MESEYFSCVNCYVTISTIKDAFISVLQNVLTFQISVTIWVEFNFSRVLIVEPNNE